MGGGIELTESIRIAEGGFPVGQILAHFIRSDSAKLYRHEDGRDQMWPGGEALSPGDVYRNPALATTLLVAVGGGSGSRSSCRVRTI